MSNHVEYSTQCDLAEKQLTSGELAAALNSAHQACATRPGDARAYCLIGAVLSAKGDWLSALETHELAWLLEPTDPAAGEGVTTALKRLRGEHHLAEVTRPLAELSPFGFYSKACRRFLRVKLLDAASRAGDLAIGEKSDVLIQTATMNIDATLCRWDRFDDHVRYFADYVKPDKYLPATSPLLSLCMVDDPVLQVGIAQKFLNDHSGQQAVTGRKMRPLGKLSRRPRIGYLSADFHDHATSRLVIGLLEAHDRTAFEVMGLSYGPDDGSEMRTRVVGACETFVDLRDKSVDSNVQALRALNLDVLVDTKGLTSDFEAAYSLSRPAPVVVNFLAYPGSMGSSAYDYIIGDQVVTPFEHKAHFTECIVHMPHAYQCNDPNREAPEPALTRTEAGLPTNAVVLAAFNQTKKITPDQFQVWMRILHKVPQAVLWLFSPEGTARRNLLAHAAQAGVPPERLVFAPSLPQREHLARHHLADLFLDTFPYNAHTTASDALWMGLPVVTQKGQSFASRVAASLLEVLGLPNLVATTPADYEALVIGLASQPQLLATYREHLRQSRQSSPLYDAQRFAQNLEQAYAFMIERSRKGKPAHACQVRDISDGGGICLAGNSAFKPIPNFSRA